MTVESRILSNDLSSSQLAAYRQAFEADAAATVRQNALTRNDVQNLAVNHAVIRSTSRTMSVKLDHWKTTNQKKSGRCWLFAALNLLRSDTRKSLNSKDFEFSQNYAMYFDKLERANYYLQAVADTAELKDDDRLLAFLSESLMGDGGQWDMATSIFKKYGVVPKEAMPETESSSNTAHMNQRLITLLRKVGWQVRSDTKAGLAASTIDGKIKKALSDVHAILTAHLGTPPERFEWEYLDDDNHFVRVGELTPKEFLAKYVSFDLDDYVCLVDDPRPEHPKGRTLTVEYLGNVVKGDPVRYLNVDIQVMKNCAKDALVNGEPVWFGCDVGPNMLREEGLWDAALFDYDGLYDIDFSLTKEERVRVGESAMTHAMLLTGVDVTDEGNTRRWRVENSWGEDSGDKGFFTMNDNWFDEYVFEVVVNKRKLSAELQQALNQSPTVLPAWDPMGALAK